MKVDGIICEKFVGDKVNTADLKQTGTKYSWDTFETTYKEKINIWYNRETGIVRAYTNMAYFMEGSNFNPSDKVCEEGFYLLSDILDTNLFEATVSQFEYGHTFQVDQPPSQFITHHTGIPKYKMTSYNDDVGKVFKGKNKDLKIYDAGINLKNKVRKNENKQMLISKGYDSKSHYIRIELNCKNPEVLYAHRNITVSQLLSNEFRSLYHDDLLNTYSQVKKTAAFTLPDQKKSHTVQNIALCDLMNLYAQHGQDGYERMTRLIKSNSTLNNNDKKSRLKTLRDACRRLNKETPSPFDLIEYLKNPMLVLCCVFGYNILPLWNSPTNSFNHAF